jgi:FkbM family methyltransferase
MIFNFLNQQKKSSKVAFNKSYSQCGEDLIIQYVFSLRGISKPSYIDIGANDPFYISNTALFYENGSRGVNIEANPKLIDNFNKFRSSDVNINIGVGPENSSLVFYVMNDNTLSTFSKFEADKFVNTGKYEIIEEINIPIITINKIIDTHCDGIFPDFLTLDAEGLDFEILKSIDFEKSHPKLICVEVADYSPTGAGRKRIEIIDFLESKDYFEYASTNLNAIMVKKEFWFI